VSSTAEVISEPGREPFQSNHALKELALAAPAYWRMKTKTAI
jgi:hypothetical protein